MISTAYSNLMLYSYLTNGVSNKQSPFSQAFLQQLTSYNLPSSYQLTANSQNTSSTTTKEVTDAWNSMNSLNTAAKTLVNSSTSGAFNQKLVNASSSAIKGTATNKAAAASYDISVSQLASAQQNSGTALDAAGTTLSAGLSGLSVAKFSITSAGGQSQNFTVAVNSGDTDKAILDKTANAINSGSTSVKAEVKLTTSGGNTLSSLVLTGASTGANSAFTVQDIAGNLASASGVNNATTTARDANYTLNGATASSATNTIKLDNGNVSLTLAATTNGTHLDVKADTSAITKQVGTFVKQYNATLHTLQSSGLTSGVQYAKQLGQNLPKNSAGLTSVGISVNANKTISFDETVFEDALASDFHRTKNLISAYGGLVAGVQKIAQNVSSQPPASLAGIESGFTSVSSSYRQQYWQSSLLNYLSGGIGSYINIGA